MTFYKLTFSAPGALYSRNLFFDNLTEAQAFYESLIYADKPEVIMVKNPVFIELYRELVNDGLYMNM